MRKNPRIALFSNKFQSLTIDELKLAEMRRKRNWGAQWLTV